MMMTEYYSEKQGSATVSQWRFLWHRSNSLKKKTTYPTRPEDLTCQCQSISKIAKNVCNLKTCDCALSLILRSSLQGVSTRPIVKLYRQETWQLLRAEVILLDVGVEVWDFASMGHVRLGGVEA